MADVYLLSLILGGEVLLPTLDGDLLPALLGNKVSGASVAW